MVIITTVGKRKNSWFAPVVPPNSAVENYEQKQGMKKGFYGRTRG